jgi:hypothetical protein
VGETAGENGFCGRSHSSTGGLSCTDADGTFPNERRDACRSIGNVQIMSVDSTRLTKIGRAHV